MEKEFIPYEQALVLKELGFDEPCFFSYELDYEYFNRAYYNYINHNTHPKLVSAPLYQQAFRWFREKYGLNQHIEHIAASNEYQWHIKHRWNTFNTYEEAELACLKKLIEIVKTK
jgi:hypothetical protein